MAEFPPADFDNLAHPSIKRNLEERGLSPFDIFQAISSKAKGTKFQLTDRQTRDLTDALLGMSFTTIGQQDENKRSHQAVQRNVLTALSKTIQLANKNKVQGKQ